MKKIFKIALCTFLFFSFASAFYALNANDIYIRPVKVRVVSEETGLPVKGLKVYNTAKIYNESFASLLHISERYVGCFLLGEYETDENGEAFLEEKRIPARTNWVIENQQIIINADCVDINLPDEKKAFYLQHVFIDEPDVDNYTYTPDKRYKNVIICYRTGSKIEDRTNRYLQEKFICYNIQFDEKGKYTKPKSFLRESDEIEIRIKNRPPVPQNGIDIKTGSHKIYSYEKKCEEIGTAVLTRKDDSYNLTLNGKAYTVEEQPYPSYTDVEIPNIVLKMDEINDKEVKGRKVLLGDYNGNKIIITKELDDSWLIPESIRKDYREYYYLIIVPEELFKKDFAKPYNLTFEITQCYKALYKAIFYEEIDK